MGVVVADVNEDGWPDVFVANDSVPNFLFRNGRDMKFTETALAAGVAVATDGKPRAGMGIDTGDYDGDGRLDLVITNLDFQMHTLHRGLGNGLFTNATGESGIGFPTLPFVGFGVAFLDFDNDAQLDLAIVNGHILDNAPQFRAGSTYQQRKLLFRNTAPRRFTEVGRSMGAALPPRRWAAASPRATSTTTATSICWSPTTARPRELLRNDGGNRGNALLVRLRGTRNLEAIGARVRVTSRNADADAGHQGRLELSEPERPARALRPGHSHHRRAARGAVAVRRARDDPRRRRPSDRDDPRGQGRHGPRAAQALSQEHKRGHKEHKVWCS